jgi:Family of unknown function (DUF6526)
MAERQPQTYATHVHRPRLFAAAFVSTVVAFGFFIYEMRRFRGPLMYGVLALGVAVMCLTLISRLYVVRLQDRIIRLEMQLRLARLGLESSFARLTVRQVIALRFASDAEMPALVNRAISENLTGKQIKEAVKDWQADWLRT